MKYNKIYSIFVFFKIVSGRLDDHRYDENTEFFRRNLLVIGTCKNNHDIECTKSWKCPGYCDDKSKNAGDACTKHKDCKGGRCKKECIFPPGVCEQDESIECNKDLDCSACDESSRNVGEKCRRNNQCKRGKCVRTNKCIFPTGFCEINSDKVCESKYDCGTCSPESRNPGDTCVRDNKCRGRLGVCNFERCIIESPSNVPSISPTGLDTEPTTDVPTGSPTNYPTDAPTDSPTDSPTGAPTDTPTDAPTDSPTDAPTDAPTDHHTEARTNTPTIADSQNITFAPTIAETPDVTFTPTSTPTSSLSPTIEEALLSDKLFGPSSPTCTNYIPENGEYSFTFDLSTLPYFDDSLADVEEVIFQVQMSHTDSNSNRTWSIKVGTGGHIYSFEGPYGESIPPNTKAGMQFVDEVNQKVCVDSVKNRETNGGGYFIHQSGVYQSGDTGYTDVKPFWFSPNVAIYCSTTVPECRMASWGQQSLPRSWTERVIYYDRYRDCGDGILERTHIMHNAEQPETDTVLTFTNMPWGGTRYTTLKDFVFSQNPDTWNHNSYNLTDGIEDPMLIFALDYGVDRIVPTPWTQGYTIFAQDLPFTTTPTFTFPGRLPADANQPTLLVDYGTVDTSWICQGPMAGYFHPSAGNYRCRFANLGISMDKGCSQCDLRFTNSNGDSFSVFNVRHWLSWTQSKESNLMYFNSHETIDRIRQVVTLGTTITVSWEERGMRPEDNVGLSFVHGRSEGMVEDNYGPSKIRYGHSNNVQRDFAVFEYISYPNLVFGDSFRARQYYVTDQFAGLSDRSAALASETIEEVIPSGELEKSAIHLHYLDDGVTTTFGSTIDDSSCNNAQATTIACTGSSTPQPNKSAFLQITCGTSAYVGTDFYHFSNFPTVPFRVMNCKVDGVTTSNRPSVKLLGYFSEADCGSVLQDKTYDANFCL